MAAAASTATPPPLKQLSEDVSRPPAVATVLAVSLRDTLRVSTLFGLLMVLWHPIYTSLVTALQTWWPMSNIALFVVGTMVVHESMYYGFNALLLAARQDPRLAAYHLPRLPHQEPSTALIWKTLRASFVGHWLIQPLTGWAIYHLFVDRGMRFDGPGPAVHVAAAQMAISLLLNDAGLLCSSSTAPGFCHCCWRLYRSNPAAEPVVVSMPGCIARSVLKAKLTLCLMMSCIHDTRRFSLLLGTPAAASPQALCPLPQATP